MNDRQLNLFLAIAMVLLVILTTLTAVQMNEVYQYVKNNLDTGQVL